MAMVVVVIADALPPPWDSWMMMVGRAGQAAAGRRPRPPREKKGVLPLLLLCPAALPIVAGPVCVVGGQRQA
jgi:hypothetical protein